MWQTDQCQIEIEPTPGDVHQCKEEGTALHVIEYYGLRVCLKLCEEHSIELTAAENGMSKEEFRILRIA